jgi:nucleotide-binding universal stress UspA family protein
MALRPGRKDKNFVAIADRVCQFYKASLTLLHVVPEEMSDEDMAAIENSSIALLSRAASKSNVIVKRAKKPIESISETSAEYDLLIIGTPEKGNWQNVLLGQNKDKFADSSACSVLRLTVKG